MPYKAIREIGEFGLIDKIAALAEPTLQAVPELLKGIGDDCAIYQPSGKLLQVATTDLLVDQVHFDLLTTPLNHLGSKAISVNVSDICAMNAFPRFALVSIAIPPSFSTEMVEELYKGMSHAAKEYGLAIAGGDTSSSRSGLIISVTIMGEVEPEKLTKRNGAKPGELICVTGSLGGAAAGLKLLMREKAIMLDHFENNEPYNKSVMADLKEYSEAIQCQLLPTARLDIVRFLHSRNICPTSMIDISDGLSSELHHICRQSNTGALIHESRIPISASTRRVADELQDDAITWALTGGEEYQLLFTIPKEEYELIDDYKEISVIGEVTDPDSGVFLSDIYGMRIDLATIRGFDHFGR
ncbi:thiamine-phosphate kinase [Chlorobium ferrooxidans]|uniref:Thiamine-monophosphate kinase n=1 Tax=Chlorobium ferrooxidans DSM 13031 TaxID=377431 RepID=Q0YSG6_9CHLB|nr:thiamine-phosphate kinase [Chlorobium ferrooxidans]EAT59233.1 thiamine-monophosphate kinase [Chlorobium ferrooxidans DSM 13031]